MACMVQHEYAIDHATVEPYHFTDPIRMRVFEILKDAGNVDGCVSLIQGDAEALELVNRLRDASLSPSDESEDDQAAIIQIAENCARRTRREYLTRNKRKEVQLAKENGNMIREEDMVNAVKINREIRELVTPQNAESSY